MTSPYSLPYLLFLPPGACFPVLDTEEPADAVGSIGGEICWADLAGGRHFPWGSPGWPRAPHPHALLAMAKEPPTLGRACAGFALRLGREQDDGSGATGFLLGDGEEAGGLLGTLAEELNGYSREKGGFSFRFGQGRRGHSTPERAPPRPAPRPPPRRFHSHLLLEPQRPRR
ncbi:orexigenic neuropeptide QRFP [Delphinapterus leucas]|uniref:Orexigenic neuropeptide QRFP n=1 Tax=Delphinapterus leucas TaxID=9749 RepID=A0A7F8K7Q1_DELLE|nr:orexigenic neuropeptide QRFP [Delphinapterus leucas]